MLRISADVPDEYTQRLAETVAVLARKAAEPVAKDAETI